MGRKHWNKEAAKKRGEGQFVPFPMRVLGSEELTALGAHAVKLLIDLLAQYTGFNNGDLCATWRFMRRRGWKSKETLNNALAELRNARWLILTRQGGRPRRASLYALSFFAIDYCNGKLDVRATAVPGDDWRRNRSLPSLAPVCWPKSKEVRAVLPEEKLRELARASYQSPPDSNGKEGSGKAH